MTTLPKGKTVDTTNLQPVEIIHMDLEFYNVTSIRGFNSMLNVVCANTIMLWVFPNAPTKSSVHTINLILTTLNN